MSKSGSNYLKCSHIIRLVKTNLQKISLSILTNFSKIQNFGIFEFVEFRNHSAS